MKSSLPVAGLLPEKAQLSSSGPVPCSTAHMAGAASLKRNRQPSAKQKEIGGLLFADSAIFLMLDCTAIL